MREFEDLTGNLYEVPDDEGRIRIRDVHGNIVDWLDPGDVGYDVALARMLQGAPKGVDVWVDFNEADVEGPDIITSLLAFTNKDVSQGMQVTVGDNEGNRARAVVVDVENDVITMRFIPNTFRHHSMAPEEIETGLNAVIETVLESVELALPKLPGMDQLRAEIIQTVRDACANHWDEILAVFYQKAM